MNGHAHTNGEETGQADPELPFQFGLRHLFAAMLVLALSFGSTRILGTWISAFVGLNAILAMAFILVLMFLQQKKSRRTALIGTLVACFLVVVGETSILPTIAYLYHSQ